MDNTDNKNIEENTEISLGDQIADQIYNSNFDMLFDCINYRTKQMIVKDKFKSWIKQLQNDLCVVCDDVGFHLSLIQIGPYQDVHMGSYDKKWASDDDYIHPLSIENDDPHDEDGYLFYKTDLSELYLEIKYTRRQVCSMGHTHYHRRYHLYSPAQWFTMMNAWYLGCKSSQFIKEYIPDFFYEL